MILTSSLVVLHEGQSQGTYETIGGIECYVTAAEGDYPKAKVVLLVTDVFGLPLLNNTLLADGFAANGFKTVMPDFMQGDPVPEANLKIPNWDRQSWFSRHSPETWQPVMDALVGALREQGVTRIGTTGYCFGAPPTFYLAFKNESHVTVITHPSKLAFPDDFEKYKATSKAHLLINSCEIDPPFPAEYQAKTDEMMGGGQFAPGYERTYWEGCIHGFAVKGDMSDPKTKAGKEGSFKATVEFYKRYL
ncbi:hypothetical protein PHLGIDRAFT_14854 [Phlebiopsis gigantea 11061_1 CR5-6]|uniref:Dienelactone hydrolase domain-containing protein n=1 Tax=Phlebiopsis gigantea (strain 11061_1 CR5-6) TaxID=745531 RepID=A0A0C3PGQ8_PHLG1|nr:hypothetical protein PHLGIDRAFT_14854 [Phlebiopsis gigantea 11061_1 CR5-6]